MYPYVAARNEVYLSLPCRCVGLVLTTRETSWLIVRELTTSQTYDFSWTHLLMFMVTLLQRRFLVINITAFWQASSQVHINQLSSCSIPQQRRFTCNAACLLDYSSIA